MFKYLTLIVILAVVVGAYPAADEAPVVDNKALPADGKAELAPKNQEKDLEGGEGGDLKGAETFGFGYYPVVYGRGYGYGGYGGYRDWGYGGYRNGWGYGGGYSRPYYW